MQPWKSQQDLAKESADRAKRQTMISAAAVAAIALVSCGVFMYGFLMRDGDSALIPVFARRVLQPSRRQAYRRPSSPLPTSPWGQPEPAAPDAADAAPIADATAVPDLQLAPGEATMADTKPHLVAMEGGAGIEGGGAVDGGVPTSGETATNLNPAAPASPTSAERAASVAARSSQPGASAAGAIAGRSLSGRHSASAGRRAFGTGFSAGAGRFESSAGGPSGATSEVLPSVGAAGGAALGGALGNAPIASPEMMGGYAGNNGPSGGGSAGGGTPDPSQTSTSGGVPGGGVPAPAHSVDSLVQSVKNDTSALRVQGGKIGVRLAMTSLILRQKEVATAADQAVQASQALETTPGIGALRLNQGKTDLLESKKILAAAVKCLKGLETQANLPASPSAARACHQQAIDALRKVDTAELEFKKLRQIYPPVFDSVRTKALARGDRRTAARLLAVKDQVSANLTTAVTVLKPEAVTAEERALVASGRKNAPRLAKLAPKIQHRIKVARSIIDSDAVPAGPHRDMAIKRLESASDNINQAMAEWSQMGTTERMFAMLYTAASMHTVTALGDLNAAEGELKALNLPPPAPPKPAATAAARRAGRLPADE